MWYSSMASSVRVPAPRPPDTRACTSPRLPAEGLPRSTSPSSTASVYMQWRITCTYFRGMMDSSSTMRVGVCSVRSVISSPKVPKERGPRREDGFMSPEVLVRGPGPRRAPGRRRGHGPSLVAAFDHLGVGGEAEQGVVVTHVVKQALHVRLQGVGGTELLAELHQHVHVLQPGVLRPAHPKLPGVQVVEQGGEHGHVDARRLDVHEDLGSVAGGRRQQGLEEGAAGGQDGPVRREARALEDEVHVGAVLVLVEGGQVPLQAGRLGARQAGLEAQLLERRRALVFLHQGVGVADVPPRQELAHLPRVIRRAVGLPPFDEPPLEGGQAEALLLAVGGPLVTVLQAVKLRLPAISVLRATLSRDSGADPQSLGPSLPYLEDDGKNSQTDVERGQGGRPGGGELDYTALMRGDRRRSLPPPISLYTHRHMHPFKRLLTLPQSLGSFDLI
ncbi:hypothetical protein EYF80_005501 [Liparis tanakae]|uniref:Uncharacterized protein n=1 Tax=Liparis tanakae TaxID=230148 RepID=A0A4Z2J2U6_9TELE|nr:hypothetical protein EYF80_005501 [Liparis tanakae]